MDNAKWQQGIVEKITDFFPIWFPFFGRLADVTSSRNEKRAIYILTSFIDAHTAAQGKISSFMGHGAGGRESDEGTARDTFTPEERNVIADSQRLV